MKCGVCLQKYRLSYLTYLCTLAGVQLYSLINFVSRTFISRTNDLSCSIRTNKHTNLFCLFCIFLISGEKSPKLLIIVLEVGTSDVLLRSAENSVYRKPAEKSLETTRRCGLVCWDQGSQRESLYGAAA